LVIYDKNAKRSAEVAIQRIQLLDQDEEWMLREEAQLHDLSKEIGKLHQLTGKLPSFLYNRMKDLQGEVRGEYRTWIILTWISSLSALVMLSGILLYFHLSVFCPLRVLIRGSRRVATDDFDYRIDLNTHDEMAELAQAMNAMTTRFREIRDDLNHQVRLRTKEIVRSEQLASVGYLAAGVAHEINNPLASIAWAAEALESRFQELLADPHASPLPLADSREDDPHPSPLPLADSREREEELKVIQKYLKRIQDEAFRCKGITEGLLDFSRMGHAERQQTDLRELVQTVVDMVQHLGKYRGKRIDYRCHQPLLAPVNAQEIKQVVLNLLTNALDSVDANGWVRLELRQSGGKAELIVTDNGCGMTEEVKEHLFEPFFTRRRDGQGTGLGLSITYRIIQDHGGNIEVQSEGPGRGSEFRVTLPVVGHEKKYEGRYQAA
jgi:signal transduction histidine kinase